LRHLRSKLFIMKLARNILLAVVSGFALYYALMFAGCWVFSLSYSQLLSEMQLAVQTVSNAPLIRYMLAVQTVSVFFVPALVLICLQHIPVVEQNRNAIRPAYLSTRGHAPLLCAIIVLILCNIPGINLLSYCNTQCVLRIVDSNSSLVQLYNHSEEVSEFLMNTTSAKILIFNLLTIALVPAIAEELFFRGLLQQVLQRRIANIHIVIFVTALIFSLFHNDVFNIVPRLVMGVLFGYLFFITKNVWYPIIAHCVHNAAVVLVYFFIHNNYLPAEIYSFGEIGNGAFVGVVSLVGVGSVMIMWWRKITPAHS